MANPSSATPHEILRERAVRLLKECPLFRYVSRRLLVDLVDKIGIATVMGGTAAIAEEPGDRIVAVVVVEGTVIPWDVTLGHLPSPMVFPHDPPQVQLTTGAYLRDHLPLRSFARLALTARSGEAVSVLVVGTRSLIGVRALMSALDLGVIGGSQ